MRLRARGDLLRLPPARRQYRHYMRVSGLVRLLVLEFLAFGRPIISLVFNSAGLAALDRLREVMGAVSRRDELEEPAICRAGCRR